LAYVRGEVQLIRIKAKTLAIPNDLFSEIPTRVQLNSLCKRRGQSSKKKFFPVYEKGEQMTMFASCRAS
jgi:hypothetical protein